MSIFIYCFDSDCYNRIVEMGGDKMCIRDRPTSVHVINGLSKFKRPNIRESILAKTAINPTTTAFNNILFPPQFYNFNSSLLVVGSCCIKTEVPQLIIFFVSSLSSSFK